MEPEEPVALSAEQSRRFWQGVAFAERFFMGLDEVHAAMRRLCAALEGDLIPYAIAGAMALNAHGYQRVTVAVDVLLTREEVDAANIGVMGHSLGGHGAYYLAAYDDRLKACVCNCGGSFLRHNPQVDAWARDRWYVYLKPIRPLLLKGQLPDIDAHEIIALIAPRAFMDVSALNDGIPLTQRQRALMLLKIADVYELVGKPENFAFFIHARGHSVPHESRELIYGFLDAHLKPEDATKTQLLNP